MSAKRKRASPDRYDDEDLEDTSDEETEKTSKPAAPAAKKKAPSSDAKKANTNANEWEIGSKRKVTVSKFRNQLKIDIREYYEKDGELLPGRKGISLNQQQWQALKDIMSEVDAALNQ